MTKLAVFTDLHANLPALRAALAAIEREGCDALVHTGDGIAIGPQPAECLDLLLGLPRLTCLMGNHDSWLVDGLPDPQPTWMSDGEVAHQRWTHAQLTPRHRAAMAAWPYLVIDEIEGVRVAFVHYGLTRDGRDFVPVRRDPTAADLDEIFAGIEADLVFYGHAHRASDVEGRARYVNPGSLGCHAEAVARYCVVTVAQGTFTVEHRAAPYEDEGLFEAFEAREVPERGFIYRAFFGGRFG